MKIDEKIIDDNEPLVPEKIREHPAWYRLINQRNRYYQSSKRCHWWYKHLRIAQVLLAVLLPATCLLPITAAQITVSAFGLLIAVLETVQQMNHYSSRWVIYRATADKLSHEKYLFLSAAGPYRAMTETERLETLSYRVERHVSTEHANWLNDIQQ